MTKKDDRYLFRWDKPSYKPNGEIIIGVIEEFLPDIKSYFGIEGIIPCFSGSGAGIMLEEYNPDLWSLLQCNRVTSGSVEIKLRNTWVNTDNSIEIMLGSKLEYVHSTDEFRYVLSCLLNHKEIEHMFKPID